MNFFRHLTYTFKLMLRSKLAMFWTVLYPMLLSGLFFVTFSSVLEGSDAKINIGIEKNNPLHKAVEYIEFFNIVNTEENKADAMLRANTISAFVEADFSLRFSKNGIEQTMIKGVFDELKQSQALGLKLKNSDYEKNFVKSKKQKVRLGLILYYSLLAMVSLYSSFGGMSLSLYFQANISELGARIATTPINKFTAYLSGIVFYIGFNLLSNTLYILFVTYVLGIPLINNIAISYLLLFIANLFGVSLGTAIGSIPKGNDDIKSMIVVFSLLFLSFLSGMMGPSIKLALDENIPFLNKINPIGLLTDSFYNVNVLGEYNLVASFCIVFTGISILFLSVIFINTKRRVQYDSI